MHVTIDPEIDAILKTLPAGDKSAYVRAAILAKYERDKMQGEFDELRAQLATALARIDALERRSGG